MSNLKKIHIQESFLTILDELEKYVEDRSSDKLSKDIHRVSLENKIKHQIDNISVYTEAFWERLSWNKDIFSTRFATRLFPTYNDEGNKVVLKKTIEKPSIFRNTPRSETIKQIQSKYDLRDTISKTLNAVYTDEGETKNSSDISYYKVLEHHKYYETISQTVVTRIFQLLLEIKCYGMMLNLFCMLLSTREYCHFAFDKTVIELIFCDEFYPSGVNPFKDPEYLEIINYFLFYGMYLLYKEECIVKAYSSPKHRFALSLDVVQWLPSYDGSIDSNPYLPISLSGSYLHCKKVPDTEYLIKPMRVSGTDRGVYNTHEFKCRFDIFTDGIFTGVNTDKIWFGGSAIAACVTRNPLERVFCIEGYHKRNIVTKYPGDEGYDSYAEELENIKSHWGSYESRLRDYFDEYYPSKDVIKKENIDDSKVLELEENLSDIDIMVDVVDDDDFDRYCNNILNIIKKNLSIRLDKESFTESEASIFRVNTNKSYKYFISGTLLKRSIEFFRLFGAHPFGGVSRFHFPAVRGVYDGRKVLLFPSYVSYAYTGLFLDYKWMSSANDTKDLILKYYTRGGTPILNETEHQHIAKHIEDNDDQWGIVAKYSDSTRYISVSNPTFRPRLYGFGFYQKIKDIVDETCVHGWYKDDPKFEAKWENEETKSRFGHDLSLRVPSGRIRPLLLWKVFPYIYSLDKSKKYTE
jgi:hypothetical protein